jgi:hypothetical protein
VFAILGLAILRGIACLDGAGSRDGDLLLGSTARGAESLDGLDDILTLNNLAENDVGTIEPAGDNGLKST